MRCALPLGIIEKKRLSSFLARLFFLSFECVDLFGACRGRGVSHEMNRAGHFTVIEPRLRPDWQWDLSIFCVRSGQISWRAHSLARTSSKYYTNIIKTVWRSLLSSALPVCLCTRRGENWTSPWANTGIFRRRGDVNSSDCKKCIDLGSVSGTLCSPSGRPPGSATFLHFLLTRDEQHKSDAQLSGFLSRSRAPRTAKVDACIHTRSRCRAYIIHMRLTAHRTLNHLSCF